MAKKAKKAKKAKNEEEVEKVVFGGLCCPEALA